MNKYIAKFEVEVEIKAKNMRDAIDLLQDVKFDKNSFGTKGEIRTKRSDMKNLNKVN